ncbi:hypothetical protein D9611_011817 [Ephemerocybe angulata]|uniref:2OGFeDO JBP1/TET oxygenase domain-containing protein n=1 Tax=Ephemerocybe angulata TaxID=980116 RepID=A0A8H5BXW5_9AGAR|nr:hypothetical protein D9611_011817 [Tulosesus angulatus]
MPAWFSNGESPQGLELCEEYSTYALGALHQQTGKNPRNEDFGENIPLRIRAELESMVKRVDEAWRNRVHLDYSLQDVCAALEENSGSKTRNEYLRDRFKGPYSVNDSGVLEIVDRPTVYIDKDGMVVAWYLPAVFTRSRSEHIFKTMKKYANTKVFMAPSRTQAWRHNPENFAIGDRCELPPVNANLALSWYSLGHPPSTGAIPFPSSPLRHSGRAGCDLLNEMMETNALVGTLLSLVHPNLYHQQMRVLVELYSGRAAVGDPERMHELFPFWSTPFTGFSLIANRETIFHRDTKGGKMLFNILGAFGRYTSGRMEVPLLGARFAYDPGCGLVIPGFLMEHGASRTDGVRV